MPVRPVKRRATHPWVVMNVFNVVLAVSAATYLQFTDAAWVSLPLWYATIWFVYMQGKDYGVISVCKELKKETQ